jgi:predicted small lipoprotein YifL
MRAWLVALMVISLALAGCGDKEKAGPGGIPYETPNKDADAYAIKVTSSNKLNPVNAKVPIGAIVEWQIENNGCILRSEDGSIDSSKHPTVSGTTYNNGDVPKGDAWRWIAVEGTHEYGCSGKDISGTIKVS